MNLLTDARAKRGIQDAAGFAVIEVLAAIILLVGIELDELLRKDVQGEQERGILEIVRDVL